MEFSFWQSYCVAPGCRNVQNSQSQELNFNDYLTYHGFPSNPETRSQWFKFINLDENSISPKIYKKWKICSNHFEPTDFEGEPVWNSEGELDRELKKTAVPTKIVYNTTGNIEFIEKPVKGKTKPRECEICGKTFKVRTSLLIHYRLHSGERPWVCSYCPSKFRHKQLFILHERCHTGEKPYSCSYCDRSFVAKSNLYVHLRVHTGERPYKCKYCLKTFNQKSALNTHIRGVHEKTTHPYLPIDLSERHQLQNLDPRGSGIGGVTVMSNELLTHPYRPIDLSEGHQMQNLDPRSSGIGVVNYMSNESKKLKNEPT